MEGVNRRKKVLINSNNYRIHFFFIISMYLHISVWIPSRFVRWDNWKLEWFAMINANPFTTTQMVLCYHYIHFSKIFLFTWSLIITYNIHFKKIPVDNFSLWKIILLKTFYFHATKLKPRHILYVPGPSL